MTAIFAGGIQPIMIGLHSNFHPSAATGFSNPMACIVENEPKLREQLRLFLQSSMIPVRAFRSGKEFLDQPHHQGPCCLVTNVALPDLHGSDLQTALAGRTEQVIFLSAHPDVCMCARVMKAGAVDFLLNPVDNDMLLEAVNRGLARSQSILCARGTRSAAQAKFDTLTTRELEVIRRVITGRLNKQIASDLGIAEKTIKIHRGRAMHKLSVESVADLVRLAMIAEVE